MSELIKEIALEILKANAKHWNEAVHESLDKYAIEDVNSSIRDAKIAIKVFERHAMKSTLHSFDWENNTATFSIHVQDNYHTGDYMLLPMTQILKET